MLKRFFSIMIVICIILSFIPVYPVYAFTPDDYLGNLSWDKMTDTEKWALCFNFTVAQCKAVLTADAKSYIENMETLRNFKESHDPDNFVSEDGKNVTIPKEFVEIVKQCIDDYAKENQPFTVEKTYRFTDIPATAFVDRKAYDYFKSLVISDSYKYIGISRQAVTGYYSFYTVDLTPVLKEGGGFVNFTSYGYYYGYYLYDFDWNRASVKKEYFDVKKDTDNNYYLEHYENGNFNGYIKKYNYAVDLSNLYNGPYLITKDGGSIRVYKSVQDFGNYSVGQRKIYYTSNYYDYVPEDLTVSIDELQKTIEDMQDVIDKLLDQITDNTSESEIEELLRQILEELRNQQGGGGGSGGGGDVNVDIDLSTTNSLLSKILAKVTQIFDKISETATGAVDTVNTKLQETLDEILSTLKSIRRWTIADTVFDGLDALADIASFLKDFLTAPAAAIGTAASSLGETANMLTDKFPFSIPWDMAALVTLLSAEPQAPVFKLPIVIESYGIEEYMEIDMSQFEYLSTIMRGMLSIIYAYGILSMTTKVIDIGGKK